MATAQLKFDSTSAVKQSTIQTGLFINGKFQQAHNNATLDVYNPSTGEIVVKVSAAQPEDIDKAVDAAEHAYNESWGEKVPGSERGKLLQKLADIIDQNADEIAAIEALDNGKAFAFARAFDIAEAANTLRYYAGWADKDHGKVIEVNNTKLVYTRHEPIGVVGQVIPWNFPFLMFAWKIGPALATGNCVIMKTAEQTPLSALKFVELTRGVLPDGVLNVVTGLGPVAGNAIASHMRIRKIAFTGSTLTGRTIMKAAAASNLKKVTLELGGKSPNVIFEDADLEEAIKWAAFGLYFNHGQCCCAGSRIYVQESIYDKFVEKFSAHVARIKVGNPFSKDTFQGPQVSQLQFDRIMHYIEEGKKEGAKPILGGNRYGDKGYFIEPTIFTEVKPDARIMKEEIFGPVVVISKFKDEKEIMDKANDSFYGLAAAVHSKDVSRALTFAHRLHAGTVWVNCYNQLNPQVPFGGFKESGIGRELGEYALENYTEVKAVHVNLTAPAPSW